MSNESETTPASPTPVASGELLPCPFCGGEASQTIVTNDARISTRFTVICISGCGASGKWCNSPIEAAGFWNFRYRQSDLEAREDEAVLDLLKGIPNEGGTATRKTLERLVRSAFQGGICGATGIYPAYAKNQGNSDYQTPCSHNTKCD